MVSDSVHCTHRRLRYAVAPALLAALLAAGSPAVAAVDDEAVTTGPAGPAATARPQTQAEARPRLMPLDRPLGAVADGPVPDPDTVSRALSDELETDWLGPEDRRAITVRDALTGQVLTESNAGRPVTPASTTKILSAAAIVTGLPVQQTFTTRVVTGAAADEVVLVAGGDMLLARGAGDPGAVAGHAGVADLAAQTADALEAGGVPGPVSVGLDLQHVAGPHQLDTWSDFWVSEGYAGRIVQLGLAEDLALPFYPSPTDPEQEVARAFAAALEDAGVEVVGWEGEDEAQDWTAELVETPAGTVGLTRPAADPAAQERGTVTQAPDGAPATEEPGGEIAGAEVLAQVESAALRDVLALALAASDNAMVEQLARQAAVTDGGSADREAVTAWIRRSVEEDYGVDLTGLELADASGLSDGTLLTVDVVADLLVAAADGSRPDLQTVLAAGGLPIAGYTGTLSSRFHLPVHEAGVGNARAKTGSLPGVTSLAGTVVSADGRLLVYSLTADDIGEDAAVLEARSSLDEVVAQLARCGC
ncbi:D-alanyl-D-alanine carboxypeptidase/D-alanyl-D-alanine-endopeptidase [Ornithinimicrobium pekingense]|uniref:D-alanyl-D-alanine carboxypeptidase/D-alanyl-D-alanine-endopeptidase n=1 Tax=Ornithinimicrobium pekingense TaxID=384677 RepID=UPI0003B634A5|nr:D-alanyl-D-alanine carboxypeptidase [Ornithinimicrobium pekingense]